MSNLAIQRTPDLIAAEINDIKNQTRKMLIHNSIEIGRRLVEAKELIPHGNWCQWLSNSVDYSQRTATNLMKLFEEYGADQISLLEGGNIKSQAFANIGYTQAVALLQLPAEDREAFIEENEVENKSTREIEKLIKERNEAVQAKEQAEKLAKDRADKIGQLEGEKKNVEKEAKKLEKSVDDLKKKLEAGKKQGKDISDTLEALKQVEGELTIAKLTIADLEKKVNKAATIDVIEAEKIVEVKVVPEEVTKELETLRIEVAKLKGSTNPAKDQTVIKFEVKFEGLVTVFRELLGTLEEMKEQDKEKYKKAVAGAIEKMQERL